ncbi:hypothetical protein PCASD_08636 [Puccinia coronata f. sp. avenae]|uniref:DUF6589 domain-containing protein n=1 Tax=Puccinia coronata f. sp. avenae TaxID=200324 RepID=A0A2N5V7D6_9BASI|nr:hypothetical protein PCASD_08636 [Puccinia coronata f. sp. avenae]
MLHNRNPPHLIKSEHGKILHICDCIQQIGWTPKKFLYFFLKNKNIAVATQRGYWGTATGWTSTEHLLDSIRRLTHKTVAGKALWRAYILKEAQLCVNAELVNRSKSAKGTFYSSTNIGEEFFESKLEYGKKTSALDDHDDSHSDHSDDSEEEVNFDISESPTVECGRVQLESARVEKRMKRSKVMAKTMVSMIAFGHNRRCNALQVWNSVVFLACGVTERMHSYFHHIGLCMSQKTAHKALASIGKTAKESLASAMSLTSRKPLSPLICIDNIDFQEKKHAISPENTSHMFHGTWGYINTINKELLKDFDPDDFSLQRYKEAIKQAETMEITPAMFIPTFEQSLHFSQVIKSQLACVMLGYLTTETDKNGTIPLDPPPIDQLKAEKPNLQMLKLMIASNNSAEGIGQVLDDIIWQTSLTEEQYHSELQILEGDLGTVLNLESLRSQRKPSRHVESSLAITFMLLGASHTLWNVSQAVYLLHFGDTSNREDLGAWSTLEALGIPSDRPLAKNDFTLMLDNMQKVHEVMLIHCLLVVMGAPQTNLPNAKMKLSSKEIQEVVDKCYNWFFSPKSLEKASKLSSPKLKNLLL